MATDLQAAIDRLYAVAPEEFVAERTRLAKELRGGGDRAAADELAKLPKPSAAAWALNHVAREERDEVQSWLDAAADLRHVSTHAAEVGGDAVRAAMAEHREATGRLLDTVADRARPGGRPLSEAMLGRVRALLQDATADAELAERMGAGRMTEEKAPAALAPPEGKTRGKGSSAKAPKGKPAPKTARRDRGEAGRAERRKELEARVKAARREAARLRKEAAKRGSAAEKARDRATAAQDAAASAEKVAASAREAASAAQDKAASAEEAAAAAEDEATAAHDAAASADAELERLEGSLRDARG